MTAAAVFIFWISLLLLIAFAIALGRHRPASWHALQAMKRRARRSRARALRCWRAPMGVAARHPPRMPDGAKERNATEVDSKSRLKRLATVQATQDVGPQFPSYANCQLANAIADLLERSPHTDEATNQRVAQMAAELNRRYNGV